MSTPTKRGFFWLAILLLFFVFLFLIRSILLPFVLGILIAYFLDPPTDRLEKSGMSRALATSIVICSFFFFFVLLSVLIFPVIINQVTGLIGALPGYINTFQNQFEPKIETWLNRIPMVDAHSVKDSLANISGFIVKDAGGFIDGVFQSGMALVNVLSLVLITPVVAFYLLEDWDRIIARIDAWLPRAHAPVIREQLRIINQTLAGFLRGQLNVCLIVALYYVVTLSILQLKFSVVLGIMTGFLLIVPYAGWMLGASIGVGIAFFQFDNTGHVLIIAATYIIGQIIEAYFLTPKLVGEKVGLQPVWVIFGLLAGGALFGFVGVLIAVPVTAVVGVLMRFALQRYLQSEYYRGETANFTISLGGERPPSL